jgi:MFS family permease
MSAAGKTAAVPAAGLVVGTLASAQFLMALDSSVMNVSIATVADDLGTTVTGIQTAITLYTLVMASLMILGGKLGAIYGRKKVFGIGIVIYAAGSLTTALAPNLTILLIGWSGLEGMGAALIMPAVVALVAGNVKEEKRAAAYGAIAAAGAIAIAVGPIIGGAVTTSFSWRWVFVAEVVVAAVILLSVRRLEDAEAERRPRLDLTGALLSIVGLVLVVYGVLRSSVWGWVEPKPEAPEILGLSPVIWMIIGGLFVLWLLVRWLYRVERKGGEPLFSPGLLANRRLTNGLSLFSVQFFMQSGVFFTIPLFLSVVLGLSAFETGLRLVPLSVGLLATAVGVPRFLPEASPRTVVRSGILSMTVGTVALIGGLEIGADAAIVATPLLLIGLGIGAMASQLGAVVVSSAPESESPSVGGLQNTATNIGASLGTALVGSLLIAALSATLIQGIQGNPEIPDQLEREATVQLEGGIPFLSDADLEDALTEAGVEPEVTEEIVEQNAAARYAGLRGALVVVVLAGLIGLFLSGGLPGRVRSEMDDGGKAETAGV